jgi:hypothetical protein
MVGQRFIQAVAHIPAVGEIEGDRLHQLALGANSLEEEDEL